MSYKLPYNENTIRQKLLLGEDSFTQFKVKFENIVSISEELVAFANAEGGIIVVGVKDDGSVEGLEPQEIRQTNLRIANAASENVIPPVYPKTQIIQIDDKNILLIEVEKGLLRPYHTKQGKYLTKSGSDKRLMSNEEMKRIILSKSVLFEELPIEGSSIQNDFSHHSFNHYFQKVFQNDYEDFLKNENQAIEQLLQNLKFAEESQFTLTGLLFFTKNPQRHRPLFIIRAVAFYGNEIADNAYLSSTNIEGTIPEQFTSSLAFIKNHLHWVQNDKSFNSIGDLEIPQIVFEEILVNALIHRDYALNSAIRLLIFKNRIEIISPGILPNHLTESNVRLGVHVPRNPILQKVASHLLPYRGLGSGIARAIKNYPDIELNNDIEKQEFKVTIHRNNNQ